MAVLHILNDPLAHGLTLPPVDDEIKVEEVTINKQVHLKMIAGRLEIDFKLLKNLNSELRHHLTPKSPYSLKVPIGKGEILLAKLNDIPVWQPPVPTYIVHKVRRGETLSLIAGRYKTSVRAIMAMNGLKRSNYLKVGWRLRIPGRKMAVSHLKRPPVRTSKLKGRMIEYVVKRGDSLWQIAQRFGTTTKVILSLNQLSSSRLRVGQVLKISKAPTASKPAKTRTYRVRKGDSPFLISKKNQMNLAEFLRLNRLTPRSIIFPGQIVRVTID